MHKLIARVLLPIFIIFTVTLPSRVVAASFTDYVPYATPYVVTAGSILGGAGLATASTAGFAVTVGMVLGYYAICPLIDGISAIAGTASPCVDIPASTAGGSAVPSPSAPATATGTTGTVYGSWSTGSVGGIHGSGSSAAAACEDVHTQYPSFTVCTCLPSGSGGTSSYGQDAYGGSCSVGVITNVLLYAGSPSSVTTCPAGYTATGSVCNLTDAYLASHTKKHDVSRSGTTLSVLLDTSPGASPLPGTLKVMTTNVSNDTVSVSTLGHNDQMQNVTSVADSGGGSTTTISQGTSSTSGATVIVTDSTGKVTSTTSVVCSSGMVYSATDGSVSAASCTNPQSPNAGSGVMVTNTVDGIIPDVYKADTVIALQASSTSTNLSDATVAIGAIGTADNEAPYGGDVRANKVGANTGTSWDWWLPDIGTLTPCSSVLSDPSFNGHTIVMSSFICGYVDNIRTGLDWFLNIGTAFYVFNLMFFKQES